MGKNNIRLDTTQQKEIYSRFRYLLDRYSAWQVWADFITMSACSLSLSDREQREEEYVSIAKRYQPEELQRICEMWLRLNGYGCEAEIVWDDISLQDIVEEAHAELYRQQAEKIKRETEETR